MNCGLPGAFSSAASSSSFARLGASKIEIDVSEKEARRAKPGSSSMAWRNSATASASISCVPRPRYAIPSSTCASTDCGCAARTALRSRTSS